MDEKRNKIEIIIFLGRFSFNNGIKNSFGDGNEHLNWDEKEDHNMRL